MLPKFAQILLSLILLDSTPPPFGGHPSNNRPWIAPLNISDRLLLSACIGLLLKCKIINFFFFITWKYKSDILHSISIALWFSVRFGSVRFGLTLDRCDPRNEKSTLPIHSSKQWIGTLNFLCWKLFKLCYLENH